MSGGRTKPRKSIACTQAARELLDEVDMGERGGKALSEDLQQRARRIIRKEEEVN